MQYSFEGLTPSAEALRMIEEVCDGDDAKLQTSFYSYDGCKSNGLINCLNIFKNMVTKMPRILINSRGV
jgi:hypothetical protein